MNLHFRNETEADRDFLFALYASTREEELQVVPWTPEQRTAFLQSQFRAQTLHYRTHYSEARFQIVVLDGLDVGRLYVWRGEKEMRVVDITLVPSVRNRGIGSQILRSVLQEAASSNCPVSLHVDCRNRAFRLYERLGFRVVEDQGLFLCMAARPVRDCPVE